MSYTASINNRFVIVLFLYPTLFRLRMDVIFSSCHHCIEILLLTAFLLRRKKADHISLKSNGLILRSRSLHRFLEIWQKFPFIINFSGCVFSTADSPFILDIVELSLSHGLNFMYFFTVSVHIDIFYYVFPNKLGKPSIWIYSCVGNFKALVFVNRSIVKF
jgi:hypothetical protein